MYLAVVLYCVTFDAASCDVIYLKDKTYPTEQACLQKAVATAQELPLAPTTVIKAYCLTVPGEEI